jgi:hypothetical protein
LKQTTGNQMPAGGFRPGSGRPKGSLNKVTASLKEQAQAYTAQALRVAVDVMLDDEAPPQARLSAVSIVLDRGHGRPEAKTEVTVRRGVEDMSRDELLAIANGSGPGAAEEDGRGGNADRVH